MALVELANKLELDKDLSPQGRDVEYKGRIRQAFSAYGHNVSKMVLTNLMIMLFAIPLIVLFFFYMPKLEKAAIAGMNFSGGLGIGYGVADDTIAGTVAIYSVRQKMILYALTPCIMLIGIGICGGYYCCRNALWGAKLNVFRTFFRGIAKSWWKFLISFTVVGLLATSFSYTVLEMMKGFATTGGAHPGLWVAVIINGLVIVAVCLFLMIYHPLVANYRFNLKAAIKNAIILSIIMAPIALVILVVLGLPMGLMFAGNFKWFLYVFLLLFGGSLYIILDEAFGQNVSDGFIQMLLIQREREEIREREKAIKQANKQKKQKANNNRKGKRR